MNESIQCQAKNCQDCHSRGLGALAGLCSEGLDYINASKSLLSIKKGKILFQEGDQARGLYCVSSGLLKVERQASQGENRILKIVPPGDFLGYSAIYQDGVQHSRATASEDSQLCFIPVETVDEVISRFPEFAKSYIGKIVKDVSASEEKLLGREKTAIQRIAESVLFLSGRFPDHNWTRKELADWAGTATETAIRSLSEFAEEGWVCLEGRKIIIKDKKALLKCAGLLVSN